MKVLKIENSLNVRMPSRLLLGMFAAISTVRMKTLDSTEVFYALLPDATDNAALGAFLTDEYGISVFNDLTYQIIDNPDQVLLDMFTKQTAYTTNFDKTLNLSTVSGTPLSIFNVLKCDYARATVSENVLTISLDPTDPSKTPEEITQLLGLVFK